MESKSILEYNVDKTQVPAIDQKRIVAFINHFVVNTVTFLNQFAVNCESKFVDFESKLLQMEASLAILESKLESIPDLKRSLGPENAEAPLVRPSQNTPPNPLKSTGSDEVDVVNNNANDEDVAAAEAVASGTRVADDERYRKYFKMIQFGVPAAAVKLKMEADGLNGELLNDPNRMLADNE